MGDAKSMDTRQRLRASRIRKEFKLKCEDVIRNMKSPSLVFDGSAESNRQLARQLTNALKQNDPQQMIPLISQVMSNPNAKVKFASECEILSEKVDEARLAAKADLEKAIKDASPEKHALLGKALDAVVNLQVPEIQDLLDEGLEALIVADHLYRSKRYIETIPNADILSMKSVGNEKNDAVVTTIRGTLLLLGTSPKEITTWDGCAESITKSGKDSLKQRVLNLDFSTLRKKKKTLKLVSKMISGVQFKSLTGEKTAMGCYGFLCGVLAEMYPSYLSEKGNPNKKLTLSWGRESTGAESEDDKSKLQDESASTKVGASSNEKNTDIGDGVTSQKSKRKLSRKPTLML